MELRRDMMGNYENWNQETRERWERACEYRPDEEDTQQHLRKVKAGEARNWQTHLKNEQEIKRLNKEAKDECRIELMRKVEEKERKLKGQKGHKFKVCRNGNYTMPPAFMRDAQGKLHAHPVKVDDLFNGGWDPFYNRPQNTEEVIRSFMAEYQNDCYTRGQ